MSFQTDINVAESDSIINVDVVNVSHESDEVLEVKNFFDLKKDQSSVEYEQNSEAQQTAVLGDSFVQQENSMTESDIAKGDLMSKIRERSKQLQIQIDEEDSENENDNSFFDKAV